MNIATQTQTDNNDDIYDEEHKISKVNAGMRQFMALLLKVFHKDDHKMLQTLKNHHNLHYDINVREFGSVPNYNGGCNEENMKSQVTNPSQLTQKRTVTLGIQTALRYAEKLIVDIGHNIAMATDQYNSSLFDGCTDYFTSTGDNHFFVNLKHGKSNDNDKKCNAWVTAGHQWFTQDEDYESNEEGDKHIALSYTRTYKKKKREITEPLLSTSFYNEVFMERIFKLLQSWNMFSPTSSSHHIVSFQTLKRDDFIFRCSPNFYDTCNSEWMDWVNVSWQFDDGSVEILPAKILMFVHRDKSCEMNMTNINDLHDSSPQFHIWAIVRSCKADVSMSNRTQSFYKCKFAKYFDLEDEINIISCDSIHEPAYVLPDRDYSSHSDNIMNDKNISRVIVLKKREKWSQLFLKQI